MKEIKTRETVKDIRLFDRAASGTERIRDAFIRTKDGAEQTQYTDAESPTGYAEDKTTESAEYAASEAEHELRQQGHRISRKVREKVKDRASQDKAQPDAQNQPVTDAPSAHTQRSLQDSEPGQTNQASQSQSPQARPAAQKQASANKETQHQSVSPEGKAPNYTARGRELARGRAAERTVDRAVIKTREHTQQAGQSVKSTAKTAQKSIKAGAKGTIKGAERGIKTAERTSRTAIKTTQATAKTTVRTAQATAKTAQKAAQIARATAKAAATTAKAAAKAIAAAVKAIIAAVKGIVAAVAAGGWVAVVIIVVIVLAAALLCSIFGLFASGESYDGSPSMPDVVADINAEFSGSIDAIIETVPHDTLVIDNAGSASMVASWNEVLALYAVVVATDPDNPAEVATLDNAKIDIMRDIFWGMNRISYDTEAVEVAGEPVTVLDATGEPALDANGDPITVIPVTYETVLTINVTYTDLAAMIADYGLNAERTAQVYELLEPEYAELFLRLTGSFVDITLSAAEVALIMETLPEDLSAERTEVVLTAYSLLDKVKYFWGGKSYVIGWDSRWGVPMKVWADGSPTTGTVRPFGLDCSGFVDWVFYQVSEGDYIIGHGGGASSQHGYCADITWSDAQPGDLVFYPGDEHVGIVGGKDESGNLLIIHCASGYNNVVVTDAGGFISIGRPSWFSS